MSDFDDFIIRSSLIDLFLAKRTFLFNLTIDLASLLGFLLD